MTDMSTASEQDWTAAIGAWNALSEDEQHIALGYLASQDPGLVRRAAAAAVMPPGLANTAIAALDGRECRAALSALAVRAPGSVLAAIAEVTGA